ncbi:transposable element Tcb1 transposase [Trichonephila clavipes]|nr:transposable element Tcb1 transposase [Trichonephila clavipes]
MRAPSNRDGSVMVWGFLRSRKLTVSIDGIMNHMVFLNILRNNQKESAKNLGSDGNLFFQQDNDFKHTACNVKCGVFAHSSNMNAIENLRATVEIVV